MCKRIREDDIEELLKLFNKKEKIVIEFLGFVNQKIIINNPEIIFQNEEREIIIKNSENHIKIKLGYVEEIFFEQKNKLKFLTENELEILITFL